jgi:phosphopantetheinyl transferase (holo-ACP synthase)
MTAIGPEVRLLDARKLGVDAAGLRARARAVTGSSGARHAARSYRYPYALVAWHSQPVGVDIERIEAFDADFLESICTPSERPTAAELERPDAYLASLWCSKEALAKGLGDALAYDPRRLESPMSWPDGEAGPWRARRLTVAPDHAAWLCWRSA